MIEFVPDGTILTANDKFPRVMEYSLAEVADQRHRLLVEEQSATALGISRQMQEAAEQATRLWSA